MGGAIVKTVFLGASKTLTFKGSDQSLSALYISGFYLDIVGAGEYPKMTCISAFS